MRLRQPQHHPHTRIDSGDPRRCQRIPLFPVLAAIIMLLAPLRNAASQSMPDFISSLGIESLARDYLRPGADAVGYSLNSGLYHTARIDDGYHLWVGVKGMWTLIPDADRTFTANVPAELTALGYPARVTSATIFGGPGTVVRSTMTDPQGVPYPDIPLPGGAGLRSAFLAVPHVTIGTIAASQIMIRGIPDITFDPEIGAVRFFGIGIAHSPTNYIRLPVDIAFMGAMQRFHVGSILTVENLNANVHASVTTDLITFFGGLGYERYDIDVSYQYQPPAVSRLPDAIDSARTISLTFRRTNLRFTAGATLTLLPFLDVTAEYSFGIQDNVSIGAGLSL